MYTYYLYFSITSQVGKDKSPMSTKDLSLIIYVDYFGVIAAFKFTN